jgi:hypothetical protein
MSLSLACLVGLTLLIGGFTAALPGVVREREPRQRNRAELAAGSERLRLVQAPGDRWFINGEPISRQNLAERLQRHRATRELRYLPSAALPMGTVSRSLAWLRQLGDHAVLLELLPPAR